MELKDRKYIKNTGNLPGFDLGNVGEFAADKLINYPGSLFAKPYEVTGKDILRLGGVSDLLSIKMPEKLNINATTDHIKNFSSPFDNVGTIIGGVANLAGSIVNAHQFNTTSDDLVNASDNSTQSIGDIAYLKKKAIDESSFMQNVKKLNTQNTLGAMGAGAASGAAIGSIVPGVGTLIGGAVGGLLGGIGGLFGGSSRKRKARAAMEEAQRSIDNMNEMSRNEAYTTHLQRMLAQKLGDTSSLSLYAYKCGKSPKYANGKQVYSAFGPVNAKPDSRVSKGEVAIDTNTGSMYRIPTGPNDTALFAGGKDPNIAIITNKYGLSDYAMVDPKGAIQMLTILKNTGKLDKNELGYKCGKLPKHADGITPWGNIISSASQGITGLSQYLQAYNDTPFKPNTYVPNPYMRSGLNTLAGLSISPYPIAQQLRSAEARTNYATRASGGLSAAQKNLARISSLYGTQQNIANLLSSVQAQNNAYKANYATSALQYGDKYATDLMTAKRHDLDYYSRSHAARQQGMQMGIYNMVDALQRGYANDFKRLTHNQNMSRYEDQRKLDWEKLRRGIG